MRERRETRSTERGGRGKSRRRIESFSEFVLPTHIIPIPKHKSGG